MQERSAWVDISDFIPNSPLEVLKLCLVGRWSDPFPCPFGRETFVLFLPLKDDLSLRKSSAQVDAKWVSEEGRGNYRGHFLHLEWSLEAGCTTRKGSENEAWIRVVGFPLHLWTKVILKEMGDTCGDSLEIDPKTSSSKAPWI